MRLYQLFACCSLAFMPSALHAEPYCAAMLNKDKIDKQYRYLAPIYNDSETGWIFGENQLDRNYEMDFITQVLMMDFVKELKARGIDLAILIAPPRPVVAGQEIVDATVGRDGKYWIEEQQFKFALLNRQLNRMGAIAPDLQALVFDNPELRESFYFSRDTHWTNVGAAHSAAALARMMGKPAFDISALSVLETFEEEGSLSAVVKKTCDTVPEPEQTTVLEFPAPGGLGLLDDAPANDTVLLGTSFSDRHRRDAYQVAEALSAALETGVVNHSVTGGGMVGPIETFILTGRLAEDQPRLIVWEFPYTYPIRERSLRQILGALRSEDAALIETRETSLSNGATSFSITSSEPHLLSFTFDRDDVLEVTVKLVFENGRTSMLELERKEVMREVATFDTWWLDLSRYRNGKLREIRMATPSAARTVRLGLHQLD